jgi:hypothetical protein
LNKLNLIRHKYKYHLTFGMQKTLALLFIFIFIFQIGCTKVLLISTGSSSSISGEASMFKPGSASSGAVGSLSAGCSSAVATLHSVTDEGLIDDTILGSSPIDEEGHFKITYGKNTSVRFDTPNVKFVVQAEGCNSKYLRPLTAYDQQDISGVSTLLTMTSDVANSSRRPLTSISRDEIKNTITELSLSTTAATSLSALLETIIATPILSQQFQAVTNIAPAKLKETPPTSFEITAPLNIDEMTSTTYRVVAYHWNPNYQIAYDWELDGNIVGNSDTFIYGTTKNSQGPHNLILKVGAKTNNGSFDLTKAYKTISMLVSVSNTFPPVVPALSLSSPFGAVISSRILTLGIATGAGKVNCDTFSSLAITENLLTPPISFPISCTTASNQPLSYTLTSANDGTKTLRLWTIDHAGNISTIPSSLMVNLDMTAPISTISSSPSSVINSTSASFVFTATDNNAISDYQCKIDSGSYASCTSPKGYSSLSEGSHTFSVKAIDVAGNEGNSTHFTWAIDTTAPVVTVTTPSTNGTLLLTSQMGAFTVGGACENGLPVVLSGASLLTPTCNSGVWSTSLDLSTQADGILSLIATQTDLAGNTTSVTRTFIKDTTGPTISFTSVPTTPQKGGDSTTISFSVTEANITASQNFTISYSSDNGSTWITSGTIASATGPLSSYSFNHILAFPSIDTGTFKVRVVGADKAGNISSITSSAFIIDSTAPVLSSVILNDSASSTGFNFVNVKLNLSDNLSGIDKVRFSDTSSSGDCQSLYANTNWVNWTNASTAINYSMSTVDGTRKICAWGRDVAGNVSVISPSAGTVGTNCSTIDYFVGFPPVVTSLSVTNGGGGSTFNLNDPVTISWTLADNEGLSNTPVDLYASVNGGAWTTLVTGYGALTGHPTTGSGTYSSYLAPSGVFRIKIVANDMNGNTSIAVLSNIMNSSAWSVYMGSSEKGVGGSGTTLTMNKETYSQAANQFAMNPINGDVYAISSSAAVYKLDASTGKTSTFIAHGSPNFTEGRVTTGLVANTTSMQMNFDSKGRLYISNIDGTGSSSSSTTKLWQIDFSANKVSSYIGGGTEPGNSMTNPSSASNTNLLSGTFEFDSQDNLYFFSACDTSWVSGAATLKYRILKATQTSTGTANAPTIIAGNCSSSDPSIGANALSSGLGALRYIHIRHMAVNSDGTLIYVSEYGPTPGTYKLVYDSTTSNYKIYSTSIGSRGIVFDRANNFVYGANQNVKKYTLPVDPTGAETSSTFVTSVGTGDCNSDSTPALSACINAYGSNGWAPLEMANDGTLLFTDNNFRIRYLDANSQLRTMMGTKPFYGEDLSRLMARGTFKGIYYKTSNSNTTAFPKGLYFLDTKAGVFGYVDPVTDIISIVAGNQEMLSGSLPDDGNPVDRNTNMGDQSGINFAGLTFDSDGLPIFGANSKVIRITSAKTLETISGGSGSGNPYWFNSADNLSTSVLGFRQQWGTQNFAMLGNNYLYSLGVNSSAAQGAFGGGIGYIDIASSKFRFLMKGVTANGSVAASSDSNISSTVTTSPLSGACYSQLCYIQLGADGNIYFSEGNQIRSLTSVTAPASTTLSTPANLVMGQQVRNFIFSPDNNRVYYISGTSLLCKWIGAGGAPTNCQNTNLGPVTGFNSLSSIPNQFTFIQDGKLLISNFTEIYLYTYTP